ncbi:MAG TPA: transcription termination factor NusA [Catalimonadaceae bacterium]|nr:transcription termination factor NusA [Catalimonadaceae bacterium]HPI09566.1 transcription termination factor NusA [Catalimonadaceae bacterium]
MDSRTLIESFSDFAKLKNIDRPTMIKILEEVFRSILRKKYVEDSNFDVIINIDKGDLEIWRFREVVDDESEDIWDYDKIPFSDAIKIQSDLAVGDELAEEINIEDDFGRRGILTAKQTLVQKVKDLEKENLFQAYKDKVGDLIIGEVYQVGNREVLLIDGVGNELILPKSEQIPKDRYRKGDNIRAVVHRVEMINGTPKIILSRTSPVFLERLFELEVPEIDDNVIAIRKIVREPGERAKVAVESFDDRIDPVGACVGMKGSRIHNIVRELENENIDVINYTENMELYIARALSPAKITSMKIDENDRRISVFLKPDQVSLAIGKGGQNIKLAGRLIGKEIDVFRDSDGSEEEIDDIALEEFDDEIDTWILEEFKKIGLDTAKSVLSVPVEDLVRRTDLEEETINEVLNILKQEFED